MVLPYKVGKERSFGLVVLLYIVTGGIYGIYWLYKSHDEVYKQFELAQEGKDEGVVWFILGLVLFQPLMFVYYWLFVSNVRHVRERFGFKKNVSAGGFLGLSIGGSIVSGIGGILFIIFLSFAIGDAGESGMSQADLDAFQPAAIGLTVAGALAMVFGLVMILAAYGMVQGNLNGIWRAYDKRMSQISGNGVSPPGALSIAGSDPRQPPGPQW